MTIPSGRPTAPPALFSPPPINTAEDTGLSLLWLQDLALKILYSHGYMSGFKIAELIALPFAGITDLILEALKREKLIEVKSSQGGLGEGAYTYGITGAGITRAREALERSQYAGPEEVSFHFKGGLIEFVKYLDSSRQALHKTVYIEGEKDNTPVEIAFQYTDGYSENIFSYVNNINTHEGGTHLVGFKTALTRTLTNYAYKNNLIK